MRLLADEDFHGSIIRGVLRQFPDLDLVRAHEVGLTNSPDAQVLAWAAETGRIVLTHDVNTMAAHAFARVRADQAMPGIILVPQDLAIGTAIEDIVLLAQCSLEDEWKNRAIFLPLPSLQEE